MDMGPDGRCAKGLPRVVVRKDISEETGLSALLNSVWRNLEWHEGPPPVIDFEDDGAGSVMDHPYLCLIDCTHFNQRLTAERPHFLICYTYGSDEHDAGDWMMHDDYSLVGPVKCVRAWARI
jgi:hypothetical protein